jgi:hypothetical protein
MGQRMGENKRRLVQGRNFVERAWEHLEGTFSVLHFAAAWLCLILLHLSLELGLVWEG